METKDLRAIVADHKALHLLLVDRKVASLNVKVAITREAQHVLTLGVPGHTVCIRLLQGEQSKREEVNKGGWWEIKSRCDCGTQTRQDYMRKMWTCN